MKIFYVLLFLSFFTAGSYTKQQKQKRFDEERNYKRNKNRNLRIAGGTVAYVQDMPYMATLIKRVLVRSSEDVLICTVTIIHPFWVIAAEICVAYKNEMQYDDYVIRSNTDFYVKDPYNTRDHEIEVWYKKRLFTDSGKNFRLYIFGASLGLIKVRTEFKDKYEVPISIAPKDFEYNINSKALQAGWGLTETGNNPLARLRKVKTRLADLTLCQKLYRHGFSEPKIVTNDMICAYTNRSGACFGDTGGPLIQSGILIGVLGYSRECAGDHWPDLYTNVAHFGAWIEQTISEDSNPTTTPDSYESTTPDSYESTTPDSYESTTPNSDESTTPNSDESTTPDSYESTTPDDSSSVEDRKWG